MLRNFNFRTLSILSIPMFAVIARDFAVGFVAPRKAALPPTASVSGRIRVDPCTAVSQMPGIERLAIFVAFLSLVTVVVAGFRSRPAPLWLVVGGLGGMATL